jgi:hypothetical protein
MDNGTLTRRMPWVSQSRKKTAQEKTDFWVMMAAYSLSGREVEDVAEAERISWVIRRFMGQKD